MNKQFAIFDMDGTLIDSMGVWNHLAQEYLANLGITAISDEVMQTIAPMTLSESAAFFVRHYALECSAQQAEEQMLRMIGPEFEILRTVPLEEIRQKSGFLIAEGIERLRNGEVERIPGFDGEYGTIKLFQPYELEEVDRQR